MKKLLWIFLLLSVKAFAFEIKPIGVGENVFDQDKNDSDTRIGKNPLKDYLISETMSQILNNNTLTLKLDYFLENSGIK